MRRPRSIKVGKYKSKFENAVAEKLTHLKFKHEYEKLKLDYTLEKTYNPDFEIVGTDIILEVKGVLDAQARVKMAAVKKYHPELDIRFVFMNPHRRCPNMKMTHAEWADKYGFPWYGIEDLNRRNLK